MSIQNPNFPTPVRMNGRLFFLRSELEYYKSKLIAEAVGSSVPAGKPIPIEIFVPANEVAKEFGLSRRTIGRRIRRNSGTRIVGAA
jgi:predicted DNA-binding transcriptional regulator AlpA